MKIEEGVEFEPDFRNNRLPMRPATYSLDVDWQCVGQVDSKKWRRRIRQHHSVPKSSAMPTHQTPIVRQPVWAEAGSEFDGIEHRRLRNLEGKVACPVEIKGDVGGASLCGGCDRELDGAGGLISATS